MHLPGVDGIILLNGLLLAYFLLCTFAVYFGFFEANKNKIKKITTRRSKDRTRKARTVIYSCEIQFGCVFLCPLPCGSTVCPGNLSQPPNIPILSELIRIFLATEWKGKIFIFIRCSGCLQGTEEKLPLKQFFKKNYYGRRNLTHIKWGQEFNMQQGKMALVALALLLLWGVLVPAQDLLN